MARELHTRVADDIRKACTYNGQLDTQQEAEMRAESMEYANEVRGFYDRDVDSYEDYDDHDHRSYEPDEDEEEGEDISGQGMPLP